MLNRMPLSIDIPHFPTVQKIEHEVRPESWLKGIKSQ